MTVSLDPLKKGASLLDFEQGRRASTALVWKWIASRDEADDHSPKEFELGVLTGADDLPRDDAGRKNARLSKPCSLLDHEAQRSVIGYVDGYERWRMSNFGEDGHLRTMWLSQYAGQRPLRVKCEALARRRQRAVGRQA